MIVVCPGCSRKYSLDDSHLKNGKKLRCAICKTVWVYESDDSSNSKDKTDHMQEIDNFIKEQKIGNDDLITKNIPDFYDGIKRKKKVFHISRKMIIASSFFVFLCVIFFARDHIKQILPNDIATIYETCCVKINSYSEFYYNRIAKIVGIKRIDLSLDDVKCLQNGNNLIISGTVVNKTDEIVEIPEIKISIKPNTPLSKEMVFVQKLKDDTIEARKSINFEFTINNLENKDYSAKISFKKEK